MRCSVCWQAWLFQSNRKAKEYIEKADGAFLIAGDVLGERPMSQTIRPFKIIEKETGLAGPIVRPLSAGLLEETIPEKCRPVNRSKLLSIHGRCRRPQIDLAGRLGIGDYPCPAGGCFLTDPGFSSRMRDLMGHHPEFTFSEVRLLKLGCYFRLSLDTKLIVGRNQQENEVLVSLASQGDLLFSPRYLQGAVDLTKRRFDETLITVADSTIARHCDKSIEQSVEVSYNKAGAEDCHSFLCYPLREEGLVAGRI